MNEDRELMELAAKAAGIAGEWHEYHGFQRYVHDPDAYSHEKPSAPWKPLSDDGDALRLAVKLNLTISNSKLQKNSCASCIDVSGISLNNHGEDPYASTRRAIVRAAAAIGESM